MPANTTPKVFISYSQESDKHSDKVLSLANQLILDGIDVQLDRYISPPQGWAVWMSQQIKNGDFILMICTPTYLQRMMQEQEEGKGLGVTFEGKAILGMLHNNQGKNINVIPVLLDDTSIDCIPSILATDTRHHINTTNSDGYDGLYRHLRGEHLLEKPALGTLKAVEKLSNVAPLKQQTQQPKINISHLPESNYTTLVGREAELTLMDNAWSDNSTRILSLIAWGGVGKTALMREWIDRLSENNYRGASHVFAYSFYSQGSNDDRQVSSDIFFREAFHHLGVTDADIPDSEYEKGAKLAEVINQHKVLLLLDGLEPLQFAPNDTNGDKAIVGKLKDSAIEALLKNLAAQNNGLVVLSSRLPVQELHTRRFAQQHDLNNLSEEAGVALLESVELEGVTITGPKQAFTDAVNELQGHALSLTLLASYLCTVCDGDIRKRDTIGSLTTLTVEGDKSQHTKKILDFYIKWFQESLPNTRLFRLRKVKIIRILLLRILPTKKVNFDHWGLELNILCLMSLFDRPVTQALIDALLAVEPLEGITDHLHDIPAPKWKFALQRLQKLRLINNQNPEQLDCHPLIRDYFTQFVAEQFPSSYQQAHECLYEYYKALPEKEFPDTLEEMQPLFAAVAHGCKAGLQQRALYEVYWPRVSRTGEDFVVHKLGAFAADLACIAQFFEQTWTTPSKNLSEQTQSYMLNWAAFRLRGLSRLAEAVQPFKAGLQRRLKEKNYKSTADNAGNLSELHLSLGNIESAINAGEQAVQLADKYGDKFTMLLNRTSYADALVSHAQYQTAHTLFIAAEQLQQQNQPEYRYLYSLQGFRYCVLFLVQGDWQEVIQRAKAGLKIAQHHNWLLDVSLEKLSLGNAYLQQAQQQNDSAALDTANTYLTDAVEGLRKAGTNHYLPNGLLARANFYTFTQQHQNAWKDFQEAFEIAHFGGMRLFLSEYHLLAAENLLIQLADSNWINYFKIANDETLELSEAELHTHLKQHLHAAENLIEQTDYQLKVPVLNRLRFEYAEQTLSAAAFKKNLAEDSQLQAGKKEIDRQKALVAGNKAVYVCREILANVERGEIEVTEQVKAEFLQQLVELKKQVEIADDFYRKPIMVELAAASLVAELISEAELSEQLFDEEEITSIQIKVEELQDQKLEKQKEIEEVNDLISQTKKENPERYREWEEKALSYASEMGISFEEALQTLLIDAIRQTKEKASQEEQMQRLREAAVQIKNRMETDDPDQFEKIKVAAKAVAEELGVDMEEAMIVVLMKAIQEGQKG